MVNMLERLDEGVAEQEMDSIEAIRIDILKMDGANLHAKQMEMEQNAYIKGLYDDISCSHTEYTDEGPVIVALSPETQAIYIADSKDAYRNRIKSLKRRYAQWQEYKNQLDPQDFDTLYRFVRGNVSEKVVHRVRLLMSNYHSMQDTEGTKRAHQDFREMKQKYR